MKRVVVGCARPTLSLGFPLRCELWGSRSRVTVPSVFSLVDSYLLKLMLLLAFIQFYCNYLVAAAR